MAANADVTAEFGTLWNFVLTLDVINTIIVLFFLWRIWFRKEERSATPQS